METTTDFDVIILGGSYAGLSAAMSLGRSLRKVLVIDDAKPCNRFTPHAHNFLTHDGATPGEIRQQAKAQVTAYDTVQFYEGTATTASKSGENFTVGLASGASYESRKIILATGLEDVLPNIPGFAECWGRSVIHCPYCHGYEVKYQPTAIIANGEMAVHYAAMIANLTSDLVLCTNGPADLTPPQRELFLKNNINIIETPIERIAHSGGYVDALVFGSGATLPVTAVYSRPVFQQRGTVARDLGCVLTE